MGMGLQCSLGLRHGYGNTVWPGFKEWIWDYRV